MRGLSLPIGVPGDFAARHAVLLGILACLWFSPVLSSHAQPYLVDAETEVRALRFQFVNGRTFDVELLKAQLALKAPDNTLPLLSAFKKKSYLFSPIELQRDVARLRRFYKQNGFPKAWVDYTIQLDALKNRIAITLNIDEGPPLIIRNLDFLGPDGQPLSHHLPGDLVEHWVAARTSLTEWVGNRLGETELIALQNGLSIALRDQGFAFSKVRTERRVDTKANRVDVQIHVELGPRGWIDEIVVEGNASVDDDVVKRELPFQEGDPYALRKLTEGQRQLFALPLFSRALIALPDQPEDSTIRVHVRVREGPRRLLRGQVGYSSEGGLLAEGAWIHRNFLGGAQVFTVAGLGNTGLLARTPRPDRRFRFSPSILQPHVLDRRLNASVSVFAELRDDDLDRSRAFGGNAALIYELESLPRPDVEGDKLVQFLFLRDVAFFGGGTDDVRGWPTGLLGPKVPDVEFRGPEGDSLVAEQYIPLGGLVQCSASMGLRFPLPFFNSSWKGLVFLDAGRVWNPDERFLPDEQQSDLGRDAERLFFSTGAGVEVPTPIGPIQLSFGYKLNPSLFDLRAPQDVLDAALAGTPIKDAETNQAWRFNLHITLGRLLL